MKYKKGNSRIQFANEVKSLFQEQGKSAKEIAEIYSTSAASIRSILRGDYMDGAGKSYKYINQSGNTIISDELKVQILEDYKNEVPLLQILQKYNITRDNLKYYR